jgi:hypothetical protein
LWASKSFRFHLRDERSAALNASFPGACWRQLYHNQIVAAHDPLFPRDLVDLSWAFNFTPRAGGFGLETSQIVQFIADTGMDGVYTNHGHLYMVGYPPLPYNLKHEGTVLDIANFGPHSVRRLSSWEWCISNENVVLISGMGNDFASFVDKHLLGSVD